MTGGVGSDREGGKTPDGWQLVQLGEVAEHVLGKMLDKSKNKGELRPYLRNVNVRWGRFDLTDVKEMRIEDGEAERYGLWPGDLLVCEGGEPGRCATWGRDEPMYFQKALHRVRTTDALDVRFLARFFEYAAGEGILARLFTGSTIKHLPGVKLGQLGLPLPPRAEQDRIVEAVESAMAAVDEATDELTEVERLIETLQDSARASVFVDSGAAISLLDDVAEIQSGVTKAPPKGGSLKPFPYIRTANVQAGYLDLEVIKEIDLPSEKAARYELRDGDVLVLEGGDADKVGRGWVWEGQIAGALHQNHVFAVRPDPNRLDPRYLAHFINSPAARVYFLGVAKQTTNLASINKTQLRAVSVPIPSIETQRQRVADLERLLRIAEDMRGNLHDRLAEGQVLRRSVLHQAFTGQLVPQDPNDEPASELLERIKSEKAEREVDLKKARKKTRSARVHTRQMLVQVPSRR